MQISAGSLPFQNSAKEITKSEEKHIFGLRQIHSHSLCLYFSNSFFSFSLSLSRSLTHTPVLSLFSQYVISYFCAHLASDFIWVSVQKTKKKKEVMPVHMSWKISPQKNWDVVRRLWSTLKFLLFLCNYFDDGVLFVLCDMLWIRLKVAIRRWVHCCYKRMHMISFRSGGALKQCFVGIREKIQYDNSHITIHDRKDARMDPCFLDVPAKPWLCYPHVTAKPGLFLTEASFCQFFVSADRKGTLFRSSADVAGFCRGSTCCTFREALLQTTAVFEPVILFWPLSLKLCHICNDKCTEKGPWL